jgi:hypothetical protein
MHETAALKNVLEMRVRSPSELRPDVAPALERVVLRALERDPTRRYGSARDFALALEEIVPHASLSAVASGVMVVSRQRLLDLSKFTAALPPDSNEDRPTQSPRPYVRPPVSALQNDVTRPIEGISVEPSPPRRSSRAGLVGLALLAVAGAVAIVVGRSSPDVSGSPVVGASVQVEAALRPMPSLAQAPAKPAPAQLTPAQLTPAQLTPAQRTPPPNVGSASAASSAPTDIANSEHALTTPANATSKPAETDAASRPQKKSAVRPSHAPSTVTSRQQPKAEPSAAKSKANCSPPTYTDADGIRHFKPECL